MTKQEFFQGIASRMEDGQRVGQAAWNVLFDALPDVAKYWVGTDLDPFHDDRKLGRFIVALLPLLDEKKGET